MRAERDGPGGTVARASGDDGADDGGDDRGDVLDLNHRAGPDWDGAAQAVIDELPAPALRSVEPAPGDAPDPAELVTAAAAEAARRALASLDAAVAAPAPAAAPVPPSAARSLEDVVLDALRPMLKQWLDQNLPPLVEAMVAKEIARIVGRPR